MKSPLTTIVALGIVTALFLALMSMFYLQQIPTTEDLRRVEPEIRREHGLYLGASEPLRFAIVRHAREGERTGVRVVCTLRPDIQKRPSSVDNHLDRIGRTILDHPDLKGRISFVTVQHSDPLPRERTVRLGEPAPRTP